MGAGVDPGPSDSFRDDLQSYTSGRAAAPGTTGHNNHSIVTMTTDTKRTHRTIRGGKTSEVCPEVSQLEIYRRGCKIAAYIFRSTQQVVVHVCASA